MSFLFSPLSFFASRVPERPPSVSDEEDSDNITSVHPVPVNPPAPDEPSSVTIPQLDDVRANLDSATFVQDQPQFGHVMAHIISGVLQQTIPGPISDALAH